MGDDAAIRGALAALGSANASDVEVAVMHLEALAGSSARSLKFMCGKDVRKRITAAAVNMLSRSSSFASCGMLRLLRLMSDSSRAAGRAVYLEVGVRTMVAVLRRASSPTEALVAACELTLIMSRHTRKFALNMRLEGGVDALCALLATNPEHAVLSPTCDLLQRCCDGNDNNLRLAHKRGAVRAALTCLRARIASASVCAPLMSLLAVLCDGPRYRTALDSADEHALSLIVSVLRRHVDDADIAIAGLALMNNVASDAELAARLCAASAFSTGWAAVVRHVATPAVLRQAVGTMWRLVSGLAPRAPAEDRTPTGTGVMHTALSTTNALTSAYAAVVQGAAPTVPALAATNSSAVLPPAAATTTVTPGTVLTVLKALLPSTGLSSPGSAPPTTLLQWALPNRYQFHTNAALADCNVLPRWAGFYLPRPGWYPPMPTQLQAFHIAYAVARSKRSKPAGGSPVPGASRATGAAPARTRASSSPEASTSSSVTPSEPLHDRVQDPGAASEDDRDHSPAAGDLASSITFVGATTTGLHTAEPLFVDTAASAAAHRAVLDADATIDVQMQLRIQISALMDGDGFMRTFRPNRQRSVSAPLAEPTSEGAIANDGATGDAAAALRASAQPSRPRPTSLTVARSASMSEVAPDDEMTPSLSSPYRSYKPAGIASPTMSGISLSRDHPGSLLASASSGLLQLADTRVDAGTVTLDTGAMGVSLSLAHKRRLASEPVASDASSEQWSESPVRGPRSMRGASVGSTTSTEAFALPANVLLLPTSTQRGGAVLPTIASAGSLRRLGSKPDVLRGMVSAAAAMSPASGEEAAAQAEPSAFLAHDGRPPLPRIRSTHPSELATGAAAVDASRRAGVAVPPDSVSVDNDASTPRIAGVPPLRRSSTFSGASAARKLDVTPASPAPSAVAPARASAFSAGPVAARSVSPARGLSSSTGPAPQHPHSAPPSPTARSRSATQDLPFPEVPVVEMRTRSPAVSIPGAASPQESSRPSSAAGSFPSRQGAAQVGKSDVGDADTAPPRARNGVPSGIRTAASSSGVPSGSDPEDTLPPSGSAGDAAAPSLRQRRNSGARAKSSAFTVTFDSPGARSTPAHPAASPTAAPWNGDDGVKNAERSATRKVAFEMARTWLHSPHWFPELQQSAALHWDLAPTRALLWKTLSQGAAAVAASSAKAASQASEYGPAPNIRGDQFVPGATYEERQQVVAEYVDACLAAWRESLLAAARSSRGTHVLESAALCGVAAGSRSAGYPFPALRVPPVHMTERTLTRTLPAATLLRQQSLALMRAILSRPGCSFDEAKIVERRLPSVAIDGGHVPAAAKAAFQQLQSEEGVPNTLRPRALRVYIQPSGTVSVRRFVLPPMAIPGAFYAAPPLGRIHRDRGTVPAIDPSTAPMLPASVRLNGGYVLLRAPPSDLPCAFDAPTELPEPLIVTNGDIRSAVIGRIMLQTIARVGVGAAQLMRHRFLGASPSSSGSAASEPSTSLADAPVLEDDTPASLVQLLTSVQGRQVYHRYADIVAGEVSVSGLAWRQPAPSAAASALAHLALPGNAPAQADVVLTAYPYSHNELAAPPLSLPKADLGVVVPLSTSAYGSDPLASDPSTLLDVLPVDDALRRSMPPRDASDDVAGDGGDDDSQGSDDEDGPTGPPAEQPPETADAGGDDADAGLDEDALEGDLADAPVGAATTPSDSSGASGADVSSQITSQVDQELSRSTSTVRSGDAVIQASIVRAARVHVEKLRERRPAASLTKRDVMRVLAEAADDVHALLMFSGPSSVASLRSIRAQFAASAHERARRLVVTAGTKSAQALAAAPQDDGSSTEAREARGAPSGATLPAAPSDDGATAAAADADALPARVDVLSKVPTLEFESRFESGNLCAANRVGPMEYELTLDADVNTAGHTQWFFFRARRMVAEDGSMTGIAAGGRLEVRQVVPQELLRAKPADDTPFRFLDTSNDVPRLVYRFHIVNLEKGGSSFNDGMRPLVYYQLAPGFDGTPLGTGTSMYVPAAESTQATFVPTLSGEGWRRAAFDIVYYRNQYTRMKGKYPVPVTLDDGDELAPPPWSVARAPPLPELPRASPQYSETWSISFPPGVHTVFFAYYYPYTYSDLRRDMVRWERRAARFTYAGEVLNLYSGADRADADVGDTNGGHVSMAAATDDDVSVAIREWDKAAATAGVDGLGADVIAAGRVKYAAATGGLWLRPSVPFAPRTGCGPSALHLPVGTSYSSPILHRTHLCHTLSGNVVPLLTITDFTSGPAAIACRPYIVLSGRVHPGETNGSWMLRGVLDFLTSSAPTAVELRRRVVFKVVPMLNPDGVINGHHRTNLAGLDLNRHWSTPDLARAPTIWHLRSLIMALQSRAAAYAMFAEGLDSAPLSMEDLAFHDAAAYVQMLLAATAVDTSAGTPATGEPPQAAVLKIMPPVPQPVLLYCDFHGHSRRSNVFTFGCHELTHDGAPLHPGDMPNEPVPTNPGSRLFPKLLAARVDTFVYPACGWKVQRDKLNCARVAMWRDACLTSAYTIEATFGGCDTGSRAGIHMTTRQLEEVGHAFCLALLDWLETPVAGSRAAEAFNRLRRAAAAQASTAPAAAVGAVSSILRAAVETPDSTTSAPAGGADAAVGKTKRPKTAAGSVIAKPSAAAAAAAPAPRTKRRSLRKT